MPYTLEAERLQEEELRKIATSVMHEGQLTWAISVLMDEFVMSQGVISYATLHRARASAQDAADEWYRVVMAPYEDKKRAENGDVYRVAEYVG
jgi:hypothetical protein